MCTIYEYFYPFTTITPHTHDMIVDNKYLWKRALSAKVPPTEIPRTSTSETQTETPARDSETQTETPSRDSETQTTGLDPSPELEQELNRTKASLQRCTEAKTRCDDASRDLVSEKNSLKNTNNMLLEEIHEEEKKKEDLISRLSEEKTKNRDMVTKLVEEEKKNEDLVREKDDLRAKISKLSEKINGLQASGTSNDNQLLNDLRAEIDSKQQEIVRLIAANNGMSGIQEDLQVMQISLSEARGTIASLQEEKDRLSGERDDLRKKVDDLTSNIRELKTSSENMSSANEDVVRDLNEKLADRISEVDRLTAMNEGNAREIEELGGMRALLTKANADIVSIQRKLADATSEKERLNTKVISLNTRIRDLEQASSANNTIITDLRAELVSSRSEVDRLNESNERNARELEEARTELAGTTERMTNLRSEDAEEKEKLNKKIIELGLKIDGLGESSSANNTVITVLRANLEERKGKINALQGQNDDYARELAGLRDSLADSRAKLADATSENKRLRQDINTLNTRIAEMAAAPSPSVDNVELVRLRAELEARDRQIMDLRALNEGNAAELASLDFLKSELNESRRKIEELEATIAAKNSEIDRLNKDLRLSFDALESLTVELQNAREEVLSRIHQDEDEDEERNSSSRGAGTVADDNDPISDESLHSFLQELDEAENMVFINLETEYNLLTSGVQQEIDRLRGDSGSLTEDEVNALISAMESDIIAIEEQKTESIPPLKSMRERIFELYTRLHRARVEDKAQALRELSGAQASFDNRLRQEIETLREGFGRDVSDLESKVNALTTNNSELTSLLRERESRIRDLESGNAQLLRGRDDRVQELEARESALQGDKDRLEREKRQFLEVRDDRVQELEKENKRLEDRERVLQGDKDQLEREKNRLLEGRDDRVQELETEKERLEARERVLQGEKDQLERERRQLLEGRDDRVQELEKENKRLEDRERVLQGDKDQLEREKRQFLEVRDDRVQELEADVETLTKWKEFAEKLRGRVIEITGINDIDETGTNDTKRYEEMKRLKKFSDDNGEFVLAARGLIEKVLDKLGLPEADEDRVISRIDELLRDEKELRSVRESINTRLSHIQSDGQPIGNLHLNEITNGLADLINTLFENSDSISNRLQAAGERLLEDSGAITTKANDRIKELSTQMDIQAGELERLHKMEKDVNEALGVAADGNGNGIEVLKQLRQLEKELISVLQDVKVPDGTPDNNILTKVKVLKDNYGKAQLELEIVQQRLLKTLEHLGESESVVDNEPIVSIASKTTEYVKALAEKNTGLENRNTSISGLTEKIEAQKVQIIDLEAQVLRLRENLDPSKIREAIQKIEQELQDAEEEARRLESPTDDVDMIVDNAEQEAPILQHIADLEQRLGVLKSRLSGLETMPSDLMKDFSITMERLNIPRADSNGTEINFYVRMRDLYERINRHFEEGDYHVLKDDPASARMGRLLPWTILFLSEQAKNWNGIMASDGRNGLTFPFKVVKASNPNIRDDNVTKEFARRNTILSTNGLNVLLRAFSPQVAMGTNPMKKVEDRVEKLANMGLETPAHLKWDPWKIEGGTRVQDQEQQPQQGGQGQQEQQVSRKRKKGVPPPAPKDPADYALWLHNSSENKLHNNDTINRDTFDKHRYVWGHKNYFIRAHSRIVKVYDNGRKASKAVATSLLNDDGDMANKEMYISSRRLVAKDENGNDIPEDISELVENSNFTPGKLRVGSGIVSNLPPISVTKVNLRTTNVYGEYHRIVNALSTRRDFGDLIANMGRERLVYLIIMSEGMYIPETKETPRIDLVPLVDTGVSGSSLLDPLSSMFLWFR